MGRRRHSAMTPSRGKLARFYILMTLPPYEAVILFHIERRADMIL